MLGTRERTRQMDFGGRGWGMRKGILATALLTGTTLPTHAANIDVKDDVIHISGAIQPNDSLVFEVETDGFNKPMVVSLHSNGGSFAPAIRIGTLIRQKGWSTHVEGRCLSACAIIWLFGSQKSMSTVAKIGFHQGYNRETRQVSGQAMNVLRNYLTKLGYSNEFIEFATQAGPADMSYFTEAESKRLGVQVIVGSMAEPSMKATTDERPLATNSLAPVRSHVPAQSVDDRWWLWRQLKERTRN
jgi:hypothetical protein